MRHVVEDVSISAHMKLCIWLPLCTALQWNNESGRKKIETVALFWDLTVWL